LKELQDLRASKEAKEKEAKELKTRWVYDVREATKDPRMLPKGGQVEKAKCQGGV
jgi:hypothetical protein